MPGICGALGLLAPDAAALAAMAHGLVDGPPEAPVVGTITAQGVAATTTTRGHLFQGEGLCAVIEGRPRWSHSEYAALAEAQGMGAALAAAYRREGQGLLAQLHGPFGLAVIDPAAGRALLAVDRLGIRPLAFAARSDGLAFASRADALLACPGVRRAIDPQALYHYLYFHVVPSPGTVYRDVAKLLPGECAVFEGGRLTRRTYWVPPYAEDAADEAELARELERRLFEAVRGGLDDAATGAYLSGGLDSSTVTGAFARIRGEPVDAYGVGFHAEGYDEMPYARATARHFGVRLHETYVTPADVAQTIATVARAYDEPFGNASAVPAYLCARAGRADGQACLLAGDGGDEIFAGNARYAKQKVFEAYHRIPAGLRRHLVEPVARGLRSVPLLKKAASYVEQARVPMPDRLETYNFLHRASPAEVLHPDLLGEVDLDGPLRLQRDTYGRAPTRELLKGMLYLDLKITLADNDLRKVNRTAELAGVEVRYPMLDESLVDFAARVPSRMLLPGAKLRHFYREALRGFLAPETLAKRKHGFALPFGEWLATDPALKAMAEESLARMRGRAVVHPAYLDRLIAEHRSGHPGYYGVMIWVLVMLDRWMEAHGWSL